MRVVKYKVKEVGAATGYLLPTEWKFAYFAAWEKSLWIFFVVDEKNPPVEEYFLVVEAGKHVTNDKWEYKGTALTTHFQFHLFQLVGDKEGLIEFSGEGVGLS